MTEPLEALNQARERNAEYAQFHGQSQPACPHCGAEYVIAEHDAWRMYAEGEHEGTCGSCDMDFRVSTRVSFSFDTDDQDAA